MKRIKLSQALQLIYQSKGKIFGVKFYKKDGSLRDMQCRLGVSKGVNGKGMSYNPALKQLVPVFDMSIGEYRMINLQGLVELTSQGETYAVAVHE